MNAGLFSPHPGTYSRRRSRSRSCPPERLPQPAGRDPKLIQRGRCRASVRDSVRVDCRYPVRACGGTQGHRGMRSVCDGRLAASMVCRCFGGRRECTLPSTATRLIRPSRLRERSGLAGACSSRRRNLGRRAILMTGCAWGRKAIPPRSGRSWSGHWRQARRPGRSKSSGYHRTWHPGI